MPPLKARWILFAVCILGMMIQIDYTAVNVALVAIAKTIKADLATAQWALSAYVLAWGAFVLAAGRLADLFGKRRTFLLGTCLFMLGSALTGAAFHPWFLIFGRVVQGVGGALFLPGLYTLVFTAFPENKRGAALGILTCAIAIGLAIGPTFGGVVMHFLSWRWIFFLNLPLGLPVIAIILWAVEKEPLRVLHEPMDYKGAVLMIATLSLLMFGLDRASIWGIAASLLLLIIFIVYERRQTHPLIQLSLFKNQIFLGSNLCYLAIGFNFSTILIISNLYLQNALDYSPLDAGFIFLTMTAMFALCSVYGGKLADTMDPRIPLTISYVAIALGLLTLAFCTQYSRLWLPLLALAFSGVGIGLGFPVLNAIMLKSVPQNLLNSASSAFTLFGCVGNTLGLIISSLVIVTFGQRRLDQLLSHQPFNLSLEHHQILNTVIGSTHYSTNQLSAFSEALIPTLMNTLRSAFIHAMTISMVITLFITLFAVIISLIMIKPSTDYL